MTDGRYDLYLWLLKDGMSKMLKIEKLTHSEAINLARRWIDIREGDFVILDQNNFPWIDNPSIKIVDKSYVETLEED